ncbi:MAG: M1 family metallopeptidase [Ginsengibacter sp.]
MKFFLCIMLFTGPLFISAQPTEMPDTSWKNNYRESYLRTNDLVHTKLEVRFDYDKSYLYGKAWITLHPHFYATDSLLLDAKGMELAEIAIIKGSSRSPLQYSYDSMQVNIRLDKVYKAGENYTIYIEYVSKPNDVKAKGSAAITNAKGLYFINPKGEDKDKPTQIWTQGETEANSVWFPTIDKPNQKTTEEIYLTVPAKYVTLSNGSLTSQKKNGDGTRTDYWKMDLPHAPYLFFIGVGDYAIVKDTYKGKEVSYYVEKEYGPVARKIFGETPAMMSFYEKITGVPYVWPKYSQIVGRDYVSGAMENTTATLHQEGAQQNARELVDGNVWERTIAHELFHQWFGDLVTAESWSNITVNESMAEYSESLWKEHRYGKDAGDATIQENRETYLSNPANAEKDLVRFYYKDKEDVFDHVSYPKGAAILHMLRNYVGDSAFFKSLNKYLTDNKFKSAEATNLRLAFEDVTGRDLNWFWNEWYLGSGHPKLKIDYKYSPNTSQVIVEQTQNTGKIFTLPVAIDVYNGADKKRYNVWIKNRVDTFSFATAAKPTLINVDADKILLVEKTDNKSAGNYVQQWKYAKNYLDRKEALDYFSANKMSNLTDGLNDKFWELRNLTLNRLNEDSTLLTPETIAKIEQIADNDPSKKVKASAIAILARRSDKKYIPLFTKYVSDSSYSVAGASLWGLVNTDPASAYTLAQKYSSDSKGDLASVISGILMAGGTEADVDFITGQYGNATPNEEKLSLSMYFIEYLNKVRDAEKVKKGVDLIMKYRNNFSEQDKSYIDQVFKQAFNKLSKTQSQYGNGQAADYINSLLK